MVEQKAFKAFCDSASKVSCTHIATHTMLPALVLVPTLAAKIKMVGFPDYWSYGTLL
jgi:hypothetical protein